MRGRSAGGRELRRRGDRAAPDRVRPLDEQTNRLGSFELRWRGILVRAGQRVDRVDGLAVDTKRHPARREHADMVGAAQEARRERRARLDEMLAVVEHEEELGVPEAPRERLPGRCRRVVEVERRGDESPDDDRIRHRGQVDEPHAATPGADLTPCDLDREACLARAAEAAERDQPVCPQEVADLRELPRPADEARERDGQVVVLLGRERHRHRVAQHCPLELPELVARLEPELVAEKRAGSPVCLERVGLAPRPVQREHEVQPEALAQRLLRNEPLELGDGVRVTAKEQVCLEPLLEADEA